MHQAKQRTYHEAPKTATKAKFQLLNPPLLLSGLTRMNFVTGAGSSFGQHQVAII